MKFPRSAGILLHISSLPGPFGIGDLGQTARDFAQFLHRAGQKIWQILPLCPPANGNSPYSSYSAFAANANLISPLDMVAQGWGTQADLELAANEFSLPDDSAEVDFEAAGQLRQFFFRKAFAAVQSDLPGCQPYRDFCQANQYWLADFALFESMARVNNSLDWNGWPEGLAARSKASLEQFRAEHQDEIEYSQFLQFVFAHQWQELKKLCNDLDIRIYGDLPIFVDHQSADVWANQHEFQLDSNGNPECVAGVPPDYFSEDGQKWGNPLYRWDVMETNDFEWWTQRFQRSLELFDIIRVDHFRGFEAYWEIPADAPTAKTGKWIQGPGEKPFRSAEKRLGELPIVAEDLGLITEDVNLLRAALDFPTMRVMQFGYGSANDNFHRPGHYPSHSFAYTGTHDNETIMGWYKQQMVTGSEETKQLLDQAFDDSSDAVEPVYWQMIKAVLNSNADSVVIPLQDYLGLDNAARMNTPSTIDANWKWKLTTSDSWTTMADSIRQATMSANR